MFDTTILGNLITGRAEPYIYAFSTETVPNYLKVGDTARGVSIRLDEWRKVFPNLIPKYKHSARIDETRIFRDFAVHHYLEQKKNLERLQPDTFDNLPYYSREFFKGATPGDIDEAIEDICQDAHDNRGNYQFYSPDRMPIRYSYKPIYSYPPRDNQQQAIDRFKKAVQAGRTNLLLYAVMRFGKSFTAMCCAEEIDARLVVIVSAKADVAEEWQQTIQSHTRFVDYTFLNSRALKSNPYVISETLADKDKKVALFLTLQDLHGAIIKEKHREVFEHTIDLLIIDETHFGARNCLLAEVLKEQGLRQKEITTELSVAEGSVSIDLLHDAVKTLSAKTRLHLSGTPYRILMSNEFMNEDIIANVQFSDILEAQQRWNDKYLNDDDRDEWDNPYFGFPQMLRFAFNPNESSLEKMRHLKKDGITYAFAELFRSLNNIKNDDGSHRQFKHEKEVLDLLEVIDGSKDDENLFGFLDCDIIKEGKMCRHIVCVLPFRASCDAMAALIKKNKDRFKNLGDYEVINIAGFDDIDKYKRAIDVKIEIENCENIGSKTLTLTVNRMMTGATVPQWDTMLYLKDTISPQEYDQAIFRLQSPYIKTFKDNNGKIVKQNMKPQTLLVDLYPDRMFSLQESKAQYYNLNTEARGNNALKARIRKELEISPIIVVNKNKLEAAKPANIIDAVRDYARNRSIMDDALELPVDISLLEDDMMAAVLRSVAPINSRKGLQIGGSKGKGSNLDVPGGDTRPDSPNSAADTNPSNSPEASAETQEEERAKKRLAAYYARILFFAFLTETIVKSLEDIIAAISSSEDNARIAGNIGLEIEILNLIQLKINPRLLRLLDLKIENNNDRMRDTRLEPIERAEIAMRKFGRMSDAEIITPPATADYMASLLPDDVFTKGVVLDIASKQGEFAVALLKRFGPQASDKIYSVCTSMVAYEFTRKIYRLLSLPVDHIFNKFTSYDIIKRDNKKNFIIPKELTAMNISAVISNPPYHEANEGNGNGSNPLYHLFIDLGRNLSPLGIMIHPGRFLFKAGKTPKDWNKKILSDPHFKVADYWIKSFDVFSDADVKGGIAITVRNENFDFGPIGLFSPYREVRSILKKVQAFSSRPFSELVYSRDLYKLTENLYQENLWAEGRQSQGHRLDIGSSFFEIFPELLSDNAPNKKEYIGLYGLLGKERVTKWIKRDYVKLPDNIDKYKVLVPKSNGTGAIGEVLSTPVIGVPVIGVPVIGHTLTFLSIGGFDEAPHAEACLKYIKSRFARLLLGTLKVTQDNPKDTWANVPLQDFTEGSDIDWSKSVEEIDEQLYAKYGLSEEEIAFIESMIKPMND